MQFFNRRAGRGREDNLEALGQAVMQFLSAPSPADKRRMLRDHPELSGDIASAMLTQLIRDAEADRMPDLVSKLDHARALLRRCKEIGVDPAFAEAGITLPTDVQYGPTPPLSPVLDALVDEAVWAYKQYERQRDDETAMITENSFARLLSHPGFAQAPLDAQLRIRNAFADFLTQRYEDKEELDILNRAIVLRREVVALSPGDWPDRPRYLRLLGSCLLLRWSNTQGYEDKSEAIRFLRAGGAAGF
jgi:hypothetical protein